MPEIPDEQKQLQELAKSQGGRMVARFFEVVNELRASAKAKREASTETARTTHEQ